MYQTILTLHSVLRWAVVISIGLALFRSGYGWLARQPYTKLDTMLRGIAGGLAQ
jgi:hypothetical protein